jgi:hypothetical protein
MTPLMVAAVVGWILAGTSFLAFLFAEKLYKLECARRNETRAALAVYSMGLMLSDELLANGRKNLIQGIKTYPNPIGPHELVTVLIGPLADGALEVYKSKEIDSHAKVAWLVQQAKSDASAKA